MLWTIFLAAQSSSRSLFVCRLVCPSVRPSVRPSVCPSRYLVKLWPLEYQIVKKTYLPSNLCTISDSSDNCDSSDNSDNSDNSDSSESYDSSDGSNGSDQKNFFLYSLHKTFFFT